MKQHKWMERACVKYAGKYTGNRFDFDGQIWKPFSLSSWLLWHFRKFCLLDYWGFAYAESILKIWFVKRSLFRTEDKLFLSNWKCQTLTHSVLTRLNSYEQLPVLKLTPMRVQMGSLLVQPLISVSFVCFLNRKSFLPSMQQLLNLHHHLL